MADEPATEAEDAGSEDESAALPAPAKKSRKKLFILAAAGVLLLGGAGGGAYMMLGNDAAAEAEATPAPEALSYVEVEPLTVNLRTPGGEARFLKVGFVLAAEDDAKAEAITAKLPLILDAYQPFLRELRPEDVAGSAAVYRLKEEMILRAAEAVGPDMVVDVLIQDLVQQ